MGVGVGAGAGEVRARARAYSRYSKTAFYRYLGIPFLYGIPVNSQEQLILLWAYVQIWYTVTFKALSYKNGIARAIVVLETLFLELIRAPDGRLITLED